MKGRYYESKAKSAGRCGSWHFPAAGSGDRGLRAADHRISGSLRHSRHPSDRAERVPLRKRVGLHGGGAEIRHSSLYSHQRLRHRRCHCAGGPGGVPHRGVSGEDGTENGQRNYGPGGIHAGGHSLGGLWPGWHDRAGAGNPENLPRSRRCQPAGGDYPAGSDDPALHYQDVRHRSGSGAPGI